jgi:predicted metal-dependent phosphoesterase TrpH
MYADLHLHSTYSDGTDTPRELFHLAKENGLCVIAIADHDSVRGVQAAISEGLPGNVQLIPAIEVSTIFNRKLLHMLGYYIDVYSSALASFIMEISQDKTENTRINFESIKSMGLVDFDWNRVLQLHPDQPRISGVHVAAAMEHDGAEAKGMTIREMFHTYFLPTGSGFIESEKMTAYDAIRIIKEAGGIPVIAHPKSIGNDSVVEDLIHAGVEGLEIYHPSHTQEESKKYDSMAKAHKLLMTGGSDWHGGNNSPNVTHMGCTGLQHDGYAIFDRLRA